MKMIIPTVLLVLSGLSTQATPVTMEMSGADCRESGIYDNLNLSYALKVENDLQDGVWTTSQNKETANVYRFQDDGILEIIQADASGEPRYESYMWRIEEYNNQAFLVLTTSDFKHELLYQTLPNCQGMVLVDPVSIDQVNLIYNPDTASADQRQINKRLAGVWENASYPYDLTNNFDDCGTFEPIDGAYLQYQFKSDGTFTKRFGSHLMQLEESGIYEIVGEGQYILFHTATSDGNYTHHVARIKYIDYGELVLEQTLESEDFAQFFCSSLKSISFVQ